MRNREPSCFKKWHENKSKARRCDSCLNDPAVKKKLENCRQERKAKITNNSNTPTIVGLSKSPDSKEACRIRDAIDDRKAQREIDKEFEL